MNYGWRPNPLNSQDPLQSGPVPTSMATDQVSVVTDATGQTSNLLPSTGSLSSKEPASKSNIPELAVGIYTDRTFFLSGSLLSGHIDLESHSNPKNLLLRSITVELVGQESLSKHGQGLAERVFLRQVLPIQSPELPPTEAVLQGEYPTVDGYWQMKRGPCRIPFAFQLPSQLPSSTNTRYGSVTYSLVLYISLLNKRTSQLVKHYRTITIFEQWQPTNYTTRGVVEEQCERWGHFGGKGDVRVKAELEDTILPAGGSVFVKLLLDNLSNKEVSEVRLSLIKRYKTFKEVDDNTLIPLLFKRKPVSEVIYKGKVWGFSTLDGQAREIVLDIQIPDYLRTVKSARLLEISYVVQVSVKATFSKAVVVELPFDSYHSSTFQQLPKLQQTEKIHYIASTQPLVAMNSAIVDSAISLSGDISKHSPSVIEITEEEPTAKVIMIQPPSAPQSRSSWHSDVSMAGSSSSRPSSIYQQAPVVVVHNEQAKGVIPPPPPLPPVGGFTMKRASTAMKPPMMPVTKSEPSNVIKEVVGIKHPSAPPLLPQDSGVDLQETEPEAIDHARQSIDDMFKELQAFHQQQAVLE